MPQQRNDKSNNASCTLEEITSFWQFVTVLVKRFLPRAAFQLVAEKPKYCRHSFTYTNLYSARKVAAQKRSNTSINTNKTKAAQCSTVWLSTVSLWEWDTLSILVRHLTMKYFFYEIIFRFRLNRRHDQALHACAINILCKQKHARNFFPNSLLRWAVDEIWTDRSKND